MSKTNKIIIQCCLCGAGTKKEQAPTVPYTAEELAEQIVAVAKAGASVAHIHVRENKEVDGALQIGYKSMSLQAFTEAVERTREAMKKAGLDIIINLTTSGGEYEDFKRLQHLGALKPEMCSFDPNTINWANSYIFENSPRFLNLLSQEVVTHDIKPEFEVFDTGHIDSVMYYVEKHGIPKPPHIQFIMGVGGSMPGTTENLAFL
ncbi:MAG: 3-keto-5-aminohexanoate cleavage protein, partial [Oscillospiraceae bacterium]|nr:3-keto-5-aminohexanoate cleavage protein [Oscillospiraceae bacterium]